MEEPRGINGRNSATPREFQAGLATIPAIMLRFYAKRSAQGAVILSLRLMVFPISREGDSIVVKSIRLPILGLTTFVLLVGHSFDLHAQDAKTPTPEAPPADKPAESPRTPEEKAKFYALPGEDPPALFVPLKPITEDDRKRIEAITDFSVARALEDRRSWSESVKLLETALKLEPDSVTVLRRLSRLCFILGRTDAGIKYSRQTLKLEPGDTDTIGRLVAYYRQKNDASGAEGILKDVLSNEKLDAKSAGRLVALYELGKLYAGPLRQFDQAADAFAKVVDRLDDKDVAKLPPGDLRRILGGDEAAAYEEFGLIFLQANKPELAVKAFERGLVYDPEDPEIPLLLIQTLLKLNKGERALQLVEQFLKRQPQGIEGYELLGNILKKLNRDAELTTRLEAAAKADSKNVTLQYFLADHYREGGQVDKADELEKALLAASPSPQAFTARALSLLKRKKASEFLRVVTDALTRPGGLEAVKEPLQAATSDKSFTLEVINAGKAFLEAKPPTLSPEGVTLLAFLATRSGNLESFLPIQRAALTANPNPQGYKELVKVFADLKRFNDAASTLEEMFAKFPEERNVRQVNELVGYLRLAEKPDEALKTAREALKLDPNDYEAQVQLALILNQTGKSDEAITMLRETAAKVPGNPGLANALGTILMQAGKNEEALKVYRQLLERFPNNDEVQRIAHSVISVIYINMGDYPKGEAELEILFEHNPDEIGVNNDLGYLYAEHGKNLEKAEAMIRKAVNGDPENHAYLDSLGWVLFKRGKLKEAVEYLTKAVKILNETSASDATIHEHLGDVYFQLKDFEKSREAWKAAEKVAAKAVPPDKHLPEIRKKLESLDKLSQVPQTGTGNTP